jgi:hypothetical protein
LFTRRFSFKYIGSVAFFPVIRTVIHKPDYGRLQI